MDKDNLVPDTYRADGSVKRWRVASPEETKAKPEATEEQEVVKGDVVKEYKTKGGTRKQKIDVDGDGVADITVTHHDD